MPEGSPTDSDYELWPNCSVQIDLGIYYAKTTSSLSPNLRFVFADLKGVTSERMQKPSYKQMSKTNDSAKKNS